MPAILFFLLAFPAHDDHREQHNRQNRANDSYCRLVHCSSAFESSLHYFSTERTPSMRLKGRKNEDFIAKILRLSGFTVADARSQTAYGDIVWDASASPALTLAHCRVAA
jgi:hypothetical protein